MRPRAVIEGRDHELRRFADRVGGVQEHHRVGAAGYGEERPTRPRKPIAHRLLNAIHDRPAHVGQDTPAHWMGGGGHSTLYHTPFGTRSALLETHGPLGTIWVGFGLGC